MWFSVEQIETNQILIKLNPNLGMDTWFKKIHFFFVYFWFNQKSFYNVYEVKSNGCFILE